VASVVGTDGDPQGFRHQIATLEAAGVEVLPSKRSGVALCGPRHSPDLEHSLLEGP